MSASTLGHIVIKPHWITFPFLCEQGGATISSSTIVKHVTAARCSFYGISSATVTNPMGLSTTLVEPKRGIKNLHQYPHARYKSLVKDHIRFARNWWLTAGNNYELVHDVGHEREASENFGEYRDDSSKDSFLLSTSRLEDLPPNSRLNALVGLMKQRWRVKDANRGFDKAKLMLMALECFSEMRLSNTIKPFDALPQPDQDTFLQYVEGCSQYAQACSHSHPEAVAILIRATQICDEMGCVDKRDEMLLVSERACEGMDRAYHFRRPPEKKLVPDYLKWTPSTEGSSSSSNTTSPTHTDVPRRKVHLSTLLPPSQTEMEMERRMKEEQRLKELFRDKPWAVEKKNNVLGTFVTARNRTQLLYPMRPKDPRYALLNAPRRPEVEGCSGGGSKTNWK